MGARFFGRKSRTIDLLPESIQKRKGFRKLAIKLAAIQVAIFICIGTVVVGLTVLEQHAWDESHELNMAVYTLRHGQAVAAVAYARDLSLRIAAEDALIAAHAPAAFDPAWLSAIVQESGGQVVTFYYTGTAILITGMTRDIGAIEIHRQGIIDAGDFRAVDLGRINLEDCGRYFYELWVRL